MNNRIKMLAVVASFITNMAVAQQLNKNKEPFEIFYKRADSINLVNPNLVINDSIYKKLKELDAKEPYFFFAEATSLYEFENDKYDYAATFFYVGLIRYKYFMLVNPNYAPGDGWMVSESMKQNYEERITLYLKNNIEKYKAVLMFAVDYCKMNNYIYWKKNTDEGLLKKVIEPYSTLLKELQINKNKYEQMFQKEKNTKLGKAQLQSIDNKSKKQWYRYNPIQVDVDTVTNKLDLYTYYKSQRSTHHYKYVKAKERLAVLDFIDKQNWDDKIKLEVFKLVTYDYGEKNPQNDVYQTEDEHVAYLKEWQKKIPTIQQEEKDRENRVKQLLGEKEGEQFLSDIIEVKIKFGKEFELYLGK